ncbi:EAL domain-containing protein [Enterobacter roggenkampii]|uniref:EAL domain-containing protein n=2 Tax=Enterobacter roggenkampii TaxID=1812935 RepID=UPI002DBDF797|nr:EAL domain-containing protein [Enterobacter roggenkampii]MEB6115077.1 EAL domain-containing protein [Enterobacter roggenkampii]
MISTKMLMKAERFFIKARTLIRETILSAELTNAEFVPFIQPVCKGDKIVGGEVLLRVLKDGIYQSPEKYLSAMESCEVINDVTCSLMSDVKTFFEGYEGSLPDDFYLSFNICARQLNSSRVIEAVTDFKKTFDGRIAVTLEIVERGTMNLDDFALDAMQQLTESGVRFAIDDFGSGSSSLKYLGYTGFTILKIDKNLTLTHKGCLVYGAILESVALLSEKLDIQIIAEGVESNNQYRLLTKTGISLYQGYLCSPPISLNSFSKQFLLLAS